MSAKILTFPSRNAHPDTLANPAGTVEHYFGGCPVCGGNDGYLNIRATHICVCDAHQTCWQIGANLFSCWRDETEETWARNEAKLDSFRVVKALPMGAPIPGATA